MGGRPRPSPARHRSVPGRAGRGTPGPPDAPRPARPATPPGATLALVVLAAVWLQVSALSLPFFADDYLFLDQARGRSLWAAWTAPDPLRNFWRPVGRQVYFWLVAVMGESPLAAHVLNLLCFATIVALLFLLARRLAGTRAAAIAATVLALHYAADVPVRWASGSQDLIAVAGALGALCLVAAGRQGWAAASLGLGLLAKETVVVTPFVALWMTRRPGQRWTRTLATLWPLGAVVVVWAILWILAMRGRSGGTIHFGPDAILAAPVHLLQVFLGAEWSRHQPLRFPGTVPPLVPLALALLAIALAGRRATARRAAPPESPGSPSAWSTGLLWALLATLPVVLVAHIWSAYYYLFALCGLALMLGALLERRPLALALAATTLLAWGSERARRLETFATDPSPWCTESHLDRFYFDRSMRWVTRYLQDLRRQRPTLPHRSTLFFSGIPAFASWQAADGPLVRWAYRDSSLRSYYTNAFSLQKARRGPFFVYYTHADSLVEEAPGPKPFSRLAASQTLAEHYDVARDALLIGRERHPKLASFSYGLAWLDLALADTVAARRDLIAAGCDPRPGPSPGIANARRLVSAGDTLAAIDELGVGIVGRALDPESHALMADLLNARSPGSSATTMEALAARLLAPGDPLAWRRWAVAQAQGGYLQDAYASLLRYFEMAGSAGATDVPSRRLLEFLRQAQPGGELAQRELRRRPKPRD